MEFIGNCVGIYTFFIYKLVSMDFQMFVKNKHANK